MAETPSSTYVDIIVVLAVPFPPKTSTSFPLPLPPNTQNLDLKMQISRLEDDLRAKNDLLVKARSSMDTVGDRYEGRLRELESANHQLRDALAQAERDRDAYRRELEEARDKWERERDSMRQRINQLEQRFGGGG